MTDKCNCLECRLRAVLVPPDGEVKIAEALDAIGNVAGEMLAHVPTKTAKRYVSELLDARKRWQSHPRVAVQQKPAGTA